MSEEIIINVDNEIYSFLAHVSLSDYIQFLKENGRIYVEPTSCPGCGEERELHLGIVNKQTSLEKLYYLPLCEECMKKESYFNVNYCLYDIFPTKKK